MPNPRVSGALSLVLASIVAACGGSSEPTGTVSSTPSAVTIVSGNGQVGLVGQALSVPLVVRVSSTTTPVKGATVTFAVVTGSATAAPGSTTTDSTGQAKTLVTLGASPGNVTITATVSGTSLAATFVVTAGAGTTTIACSSSPVTTPALGSVTAGVTGSGICLAGGAEYALVAFNSNPDTITGTQLQFGVVAHGATAVLTPSIAPDLAAVPGSALSRVRPNTLQAAFDAHLREIARRDLAPKVPAALALMRRQPSFNAVPANPTVGSLVTLNANGNDPCDAIKNRVARVAAVGTTSIVVADTMNPTGGFTDAEYQSFATMFDTLINPLDVSNFGQPSDIDKNGKIVIFFTKEVNLLTPRGSGGVIGGFFFERDLFPLSDTQDFGGCAGSNLAEMFYVLVPDPNAVFGDARTKQRVLDLTPGTLAHEYQHLINAGRRMYVNLPFNDFEQVWLNEGLSHIAEELLYYRVSGQTPRQNLSATQLGASATTAAFFNSYQGDNSARYEIFLGQPSQDVGVRQQRLARDTRRDVESAALPSGPSWIVRRRYVVTVGQHLADRPGQPRSRVRQRIHDTDSRLGHVRVCRRRPWRNRPSLPGIELEHARHLSASRG